MNLQSQAHAYTAHSAHVTNVRFLAYVFKQTHLESAASYTKMLTLFLLRSTHVLLMQHKILVRSDDSKLISIGGQDNAVVVWSVKA